MNKAGGKKTVKSRSQGAEIWHRLKKSKTSMISLGFIIVLFLAVIFADFITPYDYAGIDLRNVMSFPSREHIMGTDQYGRDLFTRILYGGRVSLLVALLATVISIVAGGVIGATAGYFGGWYDTVVMRIMDVFMAIPGLLMAITVAAALGTGMINTAIAIAISNIPSLSRIMRSSVLLLREQEYVEAAEAFGSSNARIIWKHIVPNTLAPIIVQATLSIGSAILNIAGRKRSVPWPSGEDSGGGVMRTCMSGALGAIEALMRETPNWNHRDDGCSGRFPECRSCPYHLPYSRETMRCRYFP